MSDTLIIAPSWYEHLFPAKVKLISTENTTFLDLLNELKDSNAGILIIPIEQKITGCKEYNLSGLELIKHIRLTPELETINKKPIVCLHWKPIGDYISLNIENFLLFSKGIYCKQLPFKKLNTNNLCPLQTDLRPYLLDVNEDQNYSEHILRNDTGISQFLSQLNLPQVNLINQPLTLKKAFHKSYPFYKNRDSKKIEKILNPLKILLIDDMAKEWKNALQTYMPNVDITEISSKSDFDNFINQYTENKKNWINEFSKMVLEYQDKLDNYFQLSNNKKEVNNSINSLNTQISSHTTAMTQLLSQKQTLEKELFELIGKLTENNGLIDVLISAKEDGFEIKDKTKTEANKLAIILSGLYGKSTELNLKDILIKQTQSTITVKREVFNQINNQLQEIKKEIQSIKSSVKSILYKLFKNDFDIVLLDMYMDNKSNNNLNDCEGYKIGISLKSSTLVSPLMIFSASTKTLEKSPFISDLRFIKGLTPLSDFAKTLNGIISNKPLYELLGICEGLKNFNQYYGRKFYSQQSSEFDITKLNNYKTTDIKQKISSIIGKLQQSIISTDEKIIQQNYIEIIQLLGIIQENRLELVGNVAQDSYWYATNLEKNRLADDEQYLHKVRNNASHKQTEDWKKNVNTQMLGDLIKTTYEKLLFG